DHLAQPDAEQLERVHLDILAVRAACSTQQNGSMRVLTWPIPGAVDPEAVFAARWRDAPAAFWLDTGGPGAGTSYLGAASWSITAEEIREAGHDVVSWLRAERARWDVDTGEAPDGFALGLVGWLGYEMYADTLGMPAPH